jgi:hypothetical protein
MAVLLRRFVSPALEERARAHAQDAAGEGHDHGGQDHGSADADAPLPLREAIRSTDSWREVAANFRMDWSMLWKEIALGSCARWRT